MDTDELELVEKAQSGDRRAFETLIKLYQHKVFGIAYGIVRDPEDAMEVSQEVFLRVHRNLDRFKGESKFYTWIYRIAVNLSIDYVQKRKKAPLLLHDESRIEREEAADTINMSGNVASPGGVLAAKELGELIAQGLETLSEKHRAVLVLREVEGMSYSDISKTLKCNRGTVMSRLFHARNNMKKFLQKYMEGEEI